MDYKDRILQVEGRIFRGFEVDSSGKRKLTRDSAYRKSAEGWIEYFANSSWWKDRDSWEGALLQQYDSYMTAREGAWVVSHREDLDDLQEEILCIPWYCRGSTVYKKRVYHQLRPLFGLNEKLCIHLMLSTDPKKFTDVIGAVKGLKTSWKKLHDVLYRKHGAFRYIATLEISPKSHLPHLHIMVFGVPWLLNLFDIVKKWEKYDQGSHISIKKRAFNRGLKEVLKYIFKQVDNSLLGSILWVTRSRSYMCNRGLLKPMSLHDPKLWVPGGYQYVGLVPGWRIKSLLGSFYNGDRYLPFLDDRVSFKIKDPPIDWDLVLRVRLNEIY